MQSSRLPSKHVPDADPTTFWWRGRLHLGEQGPGFLGEVRRNSRVVIRQQDVDDHSWNTLSNRSSLHRGSRLSMLGGASTERSAHIERSTSTPAPEKLCSRRTSRLKIRVNRLMVVDTVVVRPETLRHQPHRVSRTPFFPSIHCECSPQTLIKAAATRTRRVELVARTNARRPPISWRQGSTARPPPPSVAMRRFATPYLLSPRPQRPRSNPGREEHPARGRRQRP
jgi:hypothetical protein